MFLANLCFGQSYTNPTSVLRPDYIKLSVKRAEILFLINHFIESCPKSIVFVFSYEQQGKFIRQVKAQKLWFSILEAQIETGTPYMLYKDACNRKSNQKVTMKSL